MVIHGNVFRQLVDELETMEYISCHGNSSGPLLAVIWLEKCCHDKMCESPLSNFTVQVFSDIADKEKSADSTAVVFMKTIEPASTINKGAGERFSIAVKVYKDDASKYSFTWTKDGKAHNTFQNRFDTFSGTTFFSEDIETGCFYFHFLSEDFN